MTFTSTTNTTNTTNTGNGNATLGRATPRSKKAVEMLGDLIELAHHMGPALMAEGWNGFTPGSGSARCIAGADNAAPESGWLAHGQNAIQFEARGGRRFEALAA